MDALSKFDGEWSCLALEVEGKAIPDDWFQGTLVSITQGHFRLSFRTTRYAGAIQFGQRSNEDIDIIITEGLQPGIGAPGIYELVGNDLTICLGLPGRERPREFVAGLGSRCALGRLRRDRV